MCIHVLDSEMWKATFIVLGQPIRVQLLKIVIDIMCKQYARRVSVRESLWSWRVYTIFRLGRFSSQMVAKMHPETASFQGGLRMYKIVMLGEGGVGKSGKVTFDWSCFLCNGTWNGYLLAEFRHHEQDVKTITIKHLVGFYWRYIYIFCLYSRSYMLLNQTGNEEKTF